DQTLEEGPVVPQGVPEVLGVRALGVQGAAQGLLPVVERGDQRVGHLLDQRGGLGDRLVRIVHEGRLDAGPVAVQFVAVGDEGRGRRVHTGGVGSARRPGDRGVRSSRRGGAGGVRGGGARGGGTR